MQWCEGQPAGSEPDIFGCKRCLGEVPPAEEAKEVDGETYNMVDSFCYLGDMLSVEGGVDAAMMARVRCT